MKKNLKKMLRLMCCLLAMCMMATAFAGCGDTETDTDGDGTTGDNDNTETPGNDTPGTETKPGDGSEVKPGDGSEDNKPSYEFDPAVDSDAIPVKLNVGTYNIANGSKVGHDMKKLADDIKGANLDIVGLQEVDQFCNRSNNMDTVKVLSELTGMPYYAFFKAINLSGNGAGGVGEYGNAVLSKYPIEETERIELYSTGETRVLGRTKINVNGTMINFFSTHLEWSPDSTRYKQLEQLNGIMEKYDNFLIVGDFNVHTLEEYRRLNYKGMVNTEEDPILTYSSYDGDWRLDNIIYSPHNWSFGTPTTLPNGHSDHFMLYAGGVYMNKGADAVADKDGNALPKLNDGKKSSTENVGKWAEGTKGDYVTLDLGAEHCISAVNVINSITCGRVYKWAVYGAADASLPIEQWTKLCEKTGDELANGLGYTATVSADAAKLPIRYLRIYGTYHSGDETFQIAEVSVRKSLYVEEKTDLTPGATITNQKDKKFNSLKDTNTVQYVKIGDCGDCYAQIDLGQGAFLHSLKVYHPVGDGDRIYKWTAYATNDPTLPIEQWTKLGEKMGDELADSKGYTLKIAADLRSKEFRYIRICGVSYNLDDAFHLTELTVYGTSAISLRNLMKNATVTAGSGKNCDIVKDGDAGGYFDLGYWCDSDENKANGIPMGTAGNCYIEIDLQKLCNVESINVVNLISTNRIYKWDAYVTDDNGKPIDSWTKLGGKTDNATSSEAGYTLELTAEQQNTQFRYIRIYGTYHNENWGYHINEITVLEVAK